VPLCNLRTGEFSRKHKLWVAEIVAQEILQITPAREISFWGAAIRCFGRALVKNAG